MRKLSRIAETLEVDVAFHDVDMLGVVWHGQYLRYLENARWALMNRIGYGFEEILASGFVWPVIECHVRYVRSARFGDRLSVQAALVEWESRLAVNYLVTDVRTGERVARGRTVQVAVDRVSGAMQFASPPDFLRAVRKVASGPT